MAHTQVENGDTLDSVGPSNITHQALHNEKATALDTLEAMNYLYLIANFT